MIHSNTTKNHAVSLNKTIQLFQLRREDTVDYKNKRKTVSLNLFLLQGRIVFKYLRNISWGINGATLGISCNAD